MGSHIYFLLLQQQHKESCLRLIFGIFRQNRQKMTENQPWLCYANTVRTNPICFSFPLTSHSSRMRNQAVMSVCYNSQIQSLGRSLMRLNGKERRRTRPKVDLALRRVFFYILWAHANLELSMKFT